MVVYRKYMAALLATTIVARNTRPTRPQVGTPSPFRRTAPSPSTTYARQRVENRQLSSRTAEVGLLSGRLLPQPSLGKERVERCRKVAHDEIAVAVDALHRVNQSR